MPRVWADNAGGGGSGIADPGGANDDLLQKKSGAWTNRTPAQVATDLGVDGKVSKSGDTMTGYLTTPGVYGVDVGGGYKALDIADSLDYNASAFLDSYGGITLTDNVNGASLSVGGGISQFLGNVATNGGFLSVPRFKSVPIGGAKTLTLTTGDCGVVLLGSSPSTGGIVKLPSLASSVDMADFLIANQSANTVTVQAQSPNSIKHTDRSIGDIALASGTVIRVVLYGATYTYYQIAPEA